MGKAATLLSTLAALGAGQGAAPSLSSTDFALHTPHPAFESYRIPDSNRVCRAGAPLVIELRGPTTLSLTLDAEPAVASVDGVVARPITRVTLGGGRHRLYLHARRSLVENPPPSVLRFEFDAPGGAGQLELPLGDDFVNRAVLPVGRTFVSGVDLLDGHLVRQATDIALKGRHLALELTRTYSSDGPLAASALGAGWTYSYAQRLVPLPECGIWVLVTADGASQSFRATEAGFRPQRGHHTRLYRRGDGAFEFVDKAGFRERFQDPAFPGGPALRLQRIEEPHGDRVVLNYDEQDRLLSADEWHPELGSVRTLRFAWTRVAGWPRLSSVQAWGLGLRVDYRYDRHGNLALATRTDDDDADALATDRYEYASDHPRWPHRMTAALEAGAERRDYEYRTGGERGSPSSTTLPWLRETGVRTLVTHGKTEAAVTFRYDETRAKQGLFTTVVNEGGAVTRYLLNADGSPLLIDSPVKSGRQVTRMRWDPDHVVKTRQETDRGARFEFDHDARGNLIRESVWETAEAPPKVTCYEYDPEFNKLLLKVEPSGAATRYELDPRTGDLRRTVSPDGRATIYRYDPRGCLVLELGPAGRTEYSGQDSFCQPTAVRPATGPTRHVRFDARGNERKAAAVTDEAAPKE